MFFTEDISDFFQLLLQGCIIAGRGCIHCGANRLTIRKELLQRASCSWIGNIWITIRQQMFGRAVRQIVAPRHRDLIGVEIDVLKRLAVPMDGLTSLYLVILPASKSLG